MDETPASENAERGPCPVSHELDNTLRVPAAPPKQTNTYTRYKRCKRKLKNALPWIEPFCAVALVIITGFYTYYASQQTAAAIKSADAAAAAAVAATNANTLATQSSNAAKESARGYIGAINVYFPSKTSEYQRISVGYLPTGASPVFSVQRSIDWKLLNLPLSRTADKFSNKPFSNIPYMLTRVDQDEISVDVPVNLLKRSDGISRAVVIWGSVHYVTQDRPRYRNFCFVINPELQGSQERCPTHNDAD